MDLSSLRASLFMRDDFLIPLRHLALASRDICVNRVEILMKLFLRETYF